MNQELRRLLLGLGFALLAGGWGVTQFVHERQAAVDSDGQSKHDLWIGQYNFWEDSNPYAKPAARGSRDLFLLGVICMGAGAGLLGFSLPSVNSAPAQTPAKPSSES